MRKLTCLLLIFIFYILSSINYVGAASLVYKEVSLGSAGALKVVISQKGSAKARVISTLSTTNAKEFGYETDDIMTISEFSGKLKARAILSGGFMSSFSPPRGLGLVRSSGKNLSNYTKTWLGEGVFCSRGSQYLIEKFDLSLVSRFSDCLQSGPLLLSNGQTKYDKVDDVPRGERRLLQDPEDHSFVCVTRKGELILGISSAIKLDVLADSLKQKIGCWNALGLGGGNSSGLYFSKKRYGSDDLPLANVISLF